MKTTFDNSIHLGQFCINNEQMRIAAKNSQVMISANPHAEYIGIESYNENSFSDNIIWGIPRKPQDVFYKFMDVFHSVKNVDRVALNISDATKALTIATELEIDISNALTCAIAIRTKSQVLYSLYSEFSKQSVRKFLHAQNIEIYDPVSQKENFFMEDNLEMYYQNALACFKKFSMDLTTLFHK